MTVTDSETKFVDKAGMDHAIDELKKYIDGMQSGNIDLSDYVTRQELQEILDALDIDVDLSAYATKEDLQQAISNIDLSAYVTKQYVDEAVANIPTGGETDLSDYYTKEETYNKVEIDNLIPTVTNGTDGKDGADGQDGFSPIATVTKSGDTATITITDKNGTTTASISDGKNGTGGGLSGGSGEAYSAEENAIGTWIDGRTIYRKVIDVGTLPSVSDGNFGVITQDFSDTDTDIIINMRALVYYFSTRLVVDGSFFNMNIMPSTNINTYVSSVVKSQMVFIGDSKRLKFYYGSNFAYYNCTMIIEYIKAA